MSGLTIADLGPTFFKSWTIPIYYADGRVGYASEEIAIGIASGFHRFGAKLSPQDQERYEKMARKPRAAKQATQAAALLEALKFVSVATDNDAHLGIAAKHVRMTDNMAVAYDGQLAAGHPIVEELTLCPQIDQLTRALAKSGKSLVVSETPSGRLSVKGEKLQAFVPCLKPEELAPVYPDPNIAPVDERIKAAFRCCGTLASEQGKRVVEASLMLRGGDCTGTNGAAILQFWHGNDLPPMGMVLPKVFCAAVAAVKAPVVGFGCSWSSPQKVSSVTFWFEGGAWLKTQCYADDWPPIEQLWQQANYQPVPEGLFDAIETVAEFNENGFVSFAENAVLSHKNPELGASYEVKGVQPGKGFAGKLMAQVAPWAKQIDLTTYPDRAFFVGGEPETPVRGIVMGVLERTEEVRQPPPKPEPQPEPSGTIGGAQMHGNDEPEGGGWSNTGGGWQSPASGFSGEIDDDVEIPFQG